MPYRVPKSRLLPPRTAREVERLRLLERLRQGFAKSPVLVLAAGAGYGKSTLLSSLPALWLTLGEELYLRLLNTELASEARLLRQTALRELELEA